MRRCSLEPSKRLLFGVLVATLLAFSCCLASHAVADASSQCPAEVLVETGLLQTDVRTGRSAQLHGTRENVKQPEVTPIDPEIWPPRLTPFLLITTIAAFILASLVVVPMVYYSSWQSVEVWEAQTESINGFPAPIFETAFNVHTNVAGITMLTLPGAMAGSTGVITAVGCALVLGGLAGYTYALWGRACHATGGKTPVECCRTLRLPLCVQYIIPFANWCENIVYCWCMTIILKDVLTELLTTFGVHGFWASPGGILVFIGIIILLPVCSRECPPIFINSLVCAVGEIVLLLFMQLRYLDGSYMAGGQFYSEAGIRKLEETVDRYYVSPRTGVLVGMLMFNLAAHCHFPGYLFPLRGSHTLSRLNLAIAAAFSLSTAVFVWCMVVGYLTFGTSSGDFILSNYSPQDHWAMVARITTAIVAIFGFLFPFTALRDGVLALIGKDAKASRASHAGTVVLLTIIIGASFFLDDLSFLQSFAGFVFGGLVMFVTPCYLCIRCLQWQERMPLEQRIFGEVEVCPSALVMTFGVFATVLGGFIAVAEKYAPYLLYEPSPSS